MEIILILCANVFDVLGSLDLNFGMFDGKSKIGRSLVLLSPVGTCVDLIIVRIHQTL